MSLKADIDRGLAILAALEQLDVELKDIETRVKHAALHGEQVELKDADREGKQYLAAGSQRVVPVILTADKIIGEFGRDSQRHIQIMDAVENRTGLLKFFKPVNKFENRFDSGKKFRAAADEAFNELAPAFITACLARDKDGIPKSDIKIMWEESEPAK